VKSGFFFASKRSEIFTSISNFASEAKVRAHPTLHTRFEPFRFWLQIRGDIHNPLTEFSLEHSEKLLLLRKHKHFDIEAYYRNKTKTF
jgi:hypothetical protein